MADASMNKVFLLGRLGADPDVKYVKSGSAVCNLVLAIPDGYAGADGRKVERTEWVHVSTFRNSEKLGAALKKGTLVYVEGRIRTDSWTGKDGKKQSFTKIQADIVMHMETETDGDSQNNNSAYPSGRQDSRGYGGDWNSGQTLREQTLYDDQIPF